MDHRTRHPRYADDDPAFADQDFRGVREGVRDDPFWMDQQRAQRGMGRAQAPQEPYPGYAEGTESNLPRRSQRVRQEYLPDHQRGAPDRRHSLQGHHGNTDRHFGFSRDRDEGGRDLRTVGRELAEGVKRVFRGPKGYKRSDARILEDVSDRLAEQQVLDPSDIEVTVTNGEVTLRGFVSSRWEKFRAEELADDISGVSEVHNQLRLRPAHPSTDLGAAADTSPMSTDDGGRAPRA